MGALGRSGGCAARCRVRTEVRRFMRPSLRCGAVHPRARAVFSIQNARTSKAANPDEHTMDWTPVTSSWHYPPEVDEAAPQSDGEAEATSLQYSDVDQALQYADVDQYEEEFFY